MTVRRKKRTILCILLAISVMLVAAGISLCRYYDTDLLSAIQIVFSDSQPACADPVSEQPAKPDRQNIESPPIPDAPEQPQDQTITPPLSAPPVICDVAITELQTHGELQLLTGGPNNVVYYWQSDERWGSLRYGTDKISTHGCGPTAMAMVISTLTDTMIDPPSMADWAVQHGYWAQRSGSYHSIVIGTATAFGLEATPFVSRNADALREQLFAGNLFVALMGPGHFTQSGHFIVLRGVTLSGDILVADPGSAERSLTAWDAQLILDELSASTADGSPLWLISLPEGSGLE